MSGYLSAFDGVNIPIKAADQELHTDDTINGIINVAGGRIYDTHGSARAYSIPPTLSCQGIVSGADMHVVQDLIDPIRAKRGVSGTLTMTMGDATTRTRTARLMEVKMSRDYRQLRYIECELVFRCKSHGWKGTAHNTPVTIDTDPKTITVNNGGNTTVTDCVITVTAPGGVTNPMTSIVISVANVSKFTFTGTIAAGTSLVIDCGARTVKNNGVDAFSGFARHATDHKVEEWLRLESGNNSVVVDVSGGDNICTITFGFSDLWE